VRTTFALALLVGLTGCGADDPTPEPSDPSSSAQSPEETPTETPTDEPTSEAPAGPTGGTIDAPAVVEPTAALLEWNDSGVEPGTRYVKGPEWEALGSRDNSSVELARGGDAVGVAAGTGRTISEVLMSEDWAVVVRQDKAETAPSEVAVVDLATAEEGDVATPPAASGGSWALTGGDLYYPTYGDDRAYCLATYALADSNGEDGWCAPARSGFSGLTASEHGVGMMTFDDARPVACRTANLLDGSGVPQPIEGPQDCTAWDVAATADGALWSEVPKPRRQEEAHFHASADGTYFDLGPGTTGTALPCGDSVFFVRDPQGPGEPARLMRWTPEHTLEVAYESTSTGNAFLGEPACGGGVLTVASFGEKGDETVWANVT
jgi:hypothetical protein